MVNTASTPELTCALPANKDNRTYVDRPANKMVGLVLLSTDFTAEQDFRRLVPADAFAVYGNRIQFDNPTTPKTLNETLPRLARASELLLPDFPLDAICYVCTAASAVLGDQPIIDAIQSKKPTTEVVTTIGAVSAGLHHLKAKKISILTPYLPETTAPVINRLNTDGFEVLSTHCWGLEDDRIMAQVRPEVIIEEAVKACSPDADALFVSCTAVRAAEVAEEIEIRIGKPVVSSNLACIWRLLQITGYTKPILNAGTLLQSFK